MNRNAFIARGNIDHYLYLLNQNSVPSETRVTVTKLLIAEMDKLGDDLEQLAAKGRDRVDHLKMLRTCFTLGSTDHRQLEQLQALQHLLDDFCYRVRGRVSSGGRDLSGGNASAVEQWAVNLICSSRRRRSSPNAAR
jgi:hypothetical protein